MNVIDFIAQHLNMNALNLDVVELENKICSFTGKEISFGVMNKHLIKNTFTDHDYIRFNSGYSSIEAAACISPIIKGSKGLNALRNYSYIVTDNRMALLKREEIEPIILNPPKCRFVLCVTYSNKKHTAYKATINYNSLDFIVCTDIGSVTVRKSDIDIVFPVIKKWYSVINGKENSSSKPTYFTKKDILFGCNDNSKISRYGLGRYFKENAVIEKYRQTPFLKLLTHILNKNQC
jgi:hypothetical protein